MLSIGLRESSFSSDHPEGDVIHHDFYDEFEDDESPAGWVISLVFWTCLLAAGTLYGAVALAPKLHKYLEVRQQYLTNQVRLVQIERDVEHLKRVRDALENDAEFAAQMAKLDFQMAQDDAELIPVDSELSRGARDFTAEGAPILPPIEPSYPFVQLLAESHFWRSFLITMSAGLTLTAFTFLHHPQMKQRRADRKAKRMRTHAASPPRRSRLFARYRLPEEGQKVSDV